MLALAVMKPNITQQTVRTADETQELIPKLSSTDERWKEAVFIRDICFASKAFSEVNDIRDSF